MHLIYTNMPTAPTIFLLYYNLQLGIIPVSTCIFVLLVVFCIFKQ